MFFSIYNSQVNAMKNLPYHHLADGTFRNPEGSPVRDMKFNWSYKIFNDEKKKLDMFVPKDHIIEKEKVIKSLSDNKNDDYVFWIGHATFLIKLGDTTIITDPVFENNYGPMVFGPKKYIESPLTLKELPKIDLFLLTHNHYDHMSIRTIKNFPYKNTKVLVPLKLGKYLQKMDIKKILLKKWIGSIKSKLMMKSQ